MQCAAKVITAREEEKDVDRSVKQKTRESKIKVIAKQL